MMADVSKREQVAQWYDRNAAIQHEAGSGALASLWTKFAARVRNGDADHRLNQIIDQQAEYDAAEIQQAA